jgi:hypothetical protein
MLPGAPGTVRRRLCCSIQDLPTQKKGKRQMREPFKSLDRLALKNRLAAIGRGNTD